MLRGALPTPHVASSNVDTDRGIASIGLPVGRCDCSLFMPLRKDFPYEADQNYMRLGSGIVELWVYMEKIHVKEAFFDSSLEVSRFVVHESQ